MKPTVNAQGTIISPPIEIIFVDKIMKFLDDSKKFNANVHANTSTIPPTAEQEMNNGDLRGKSNCNETFSVNINHTTALAMTTVKIKRE